MVRELSAQELDWKVQGTGIYQNLTLRCLATMVETDALTAVDSGRKRIVIPEIVPLSEQKQRTR